MTEMVSLSWEELHTLALDAMLGRGFAPAEAEITVTCLLEAERDGIPSHGLSRLPFYLDQAVTGKVNASAMPKVTTRGAIVHVDACHGLAFPAVHRGLEEGMNCARQHGLCAIAIGHSHHFGVAGAPVERAARQGFMALAFSNAPSAMAPWGGCTPLFGTNPIAFACPRQGRDPLLLDLSLSKVARGKVMLAKKAGASIPEGWAIGMDGRPTTDPDEAIAGSMLPAGDAKGAALALMVELLSAGLTGSRFGFEATSFFDADGEPPGVGHLILLLDTRQYAADLLQRVEVLFSAMLEQPGVRLPGDRRFARRQQAGEQMEVPLAVIRELEGHALPA